MNHRTQGIALLEVLVALTILGTTGLALAAATSQALATEHLAERAEVELLAADRLLSAMTLLNRRDLVMRIGRHQVGDFVVDVQRPEPGLYRLAVADTLPPYTERLVTVVHRPEPAP